MIITILGYMGAGKSVVGKQLSQKLEYDFIDLDDEISHQNQLSVQEIFTTKGEIFFRKEERRILEQLINKEKLVISLGGGTPAYYDNIQLVNANSYSIFLQANAQILAERLFTERKKRPLIANIQSKQKLQEFINIHLFERNVFYHQAKLTINIAQKSVSEIVTEIVTHLPQN